jgi:hypothetical protein
MNSSHISTVHLAQDFVPSFLPRLAGFQKGPIEDKGVCRLAFVTPSCPTTDAFNGVRVLSTISLRSVTLQS